MSITTRTLCRIHSPYSFMTPFMLLRLQRISFVLTYSLFIRSVAGLHCQPFVPFQNVKPRNVLLVGRTTFVLVALTFNRNSLSNHPVMDFITRSAAISLLT